MKVLIFTPTWETENGTAMHPDCRRSVAEQEIDGEITRIISTDNPFPVGDHRNVLYQYQLARQMFLAADYDALLTVEHDNVLPDWRAVQRLINTPGDIVYGPYVFRRTRTISAWRYENDREQGMPLDNYPAELEKAKAAGAWRVSGVGQGCTLYRRHVLDALEFRANSDGIHYCPDIPFADDALHAHFVSMAQFSVPVGHWHGDEFLMPYGRRWRMHSYKILETVNVNTVTGRWLALHAGDVIDLRREEAEALAAVGYIELPKIGTIPTNGEIEHAVVEPPEQAVAPAQRKTRKGVGK